MPAGTGTVVGHRPHTDPQAVCTCECGCACAAAQKSASAVRYSNGELELESSQLASAGFGQPWGHTPYYLNRILINDVPTTYDFGQGYNWLVTQWPFITIKSTGILEVVRGLNQYFFFEDTGGGSYAPLFGSMQTLVHDSGAGLFRMTDPDGFVWEFKDFDQGATAGLFSTLTTPGNQVVSVQSYTGDRLGTVQQTFGSGNSFQAQQYVYEYLSSGPNAGRLLYVTLRRLIPGTAVYSNIRRMRYEYYVAGDSHGSLGDLKLVVSQLPQGTGWIDHETSYYRYWKDSACGRGFQHGLKFSLGPDAFARLSAAADPFTACDELVAQFADRYFEYDGQQRVTHTSTAAGTQPYSLVIEPRPGSFTFGYNTWAQKTTETLADGSQNIVFTNHVGQVILKEKTDGTNSWLDYFEYDALDAHEVLHARPAAVSGYTVQPVTNDLVVTLHNSAGLIEITDYYPTTDLPNGAVEGYKSFDKIKEGSAGTEIPLRQTQYTSASAGGLTIYPIWKTTVFRNENGTGPIVTEQAYTYFSGTLQVQQQTTTLPVVSVAQNGDGLTHTVAQVFDALGNLNWSQDARGFITYRAVNPATAATTQQILDVDMSRMVGVPGNPGWTTPAGGGLHLISDYESDPLGRQTLSLGPWHNVNGQAVRTASFMVYLDAQHQTWSGQGYATLSG